MLQILTCRLENIVFIFLLLCGDNVAHSIFQSGKEYVYSYNALSSSGVLLPSVASSSWGFHGKLIIQTEQNVATLQVHITAILDES